MRESADYIAADLLSQAEHDKLATAVLITNSNASCPGRFQRGG